MVKKKQLKFDSVTAKELLTMPIASYMSAKLYVSHYCPAGCLRVENEEEKHEDEELLITGMAKSQMPRSII